MLCTKTTATVMPSSIYQGLPPCTGHGGLKTQSIAGTCLSDGGRAVLGARGLCKVALKEYYDGSNCHAQPQGRSAAPGQAGELHPALQVVPNPANGTVTLKLPSPDDKAGELLVVNMNGQLMFKARTGEGQKELHLSTGAWPAGNYIVKFRNQAAVQVRTFVVQH